MGSPAEGDGHVFNGTGSGLRLEVFFLLFKGTSGTGVFEGTFFQMQGKRCSWVSLEGIGCQTFSKVCSGKAWRGYLLRVPVLRLVQRE